MQGETSGIQFSWSDLWKKEDYWAIWMGLGIVIVAIIFFYSNSTISPIAITPPQWVSFDTVLQSFASQWLWYLLLFGAFTVVFSISSRIMGFRLKQYVPGFIIIFIGSLCILVFSSWKYAHDYNLEAPLVALLVGLIIGNTGRLPKWMEASLRTEYYIKTGIVLLGATLPLTLIINAGPIAFIQATIVAVSTFLTIWFMAVKVFKLDKRFGAVLGGAGSVCGVSAAIAIGGSVQAHKDHVAIGISIVSLWAIVMIFILPFACRALGLPAGVSGAWIGTSEFADAAGFAAAASIGHEAAIQTYTLMKVIGRDIWIGLWSFILAVIACYYWETGPSDLGPKKSTRALAEVCNRFPKFVIGFFAASIIMSLVAAGYNTQEFNSVLKPDLIAPIKNLRTWTFVFTFLCIGLTTRFKELLQFGWKPFNAFTVGVLVNVPLGYILSTIVFRDYWTAIK
ncbi:MAG: putative sulfate exporter family transporter [Candidatus Zixiibacteriota bacterium]|jgi:uncharacterized integral membrane protein (TIGR00698 family)